MKKLSMILLIFMVVTGLVFGEEPRNASLKKEGETVFYYDWKGKLIKTIDLKTKRVEYSDKIAEYSEVINSDSGRSFLNALPVKVTETYYNYNIKTINYEKYQYNELGLPVSIKKYDERTMIIQKEKKEEDLPC